MPPKHAHAIPRTYRPTTGPRSPEMFWFLETKSQTAGSPCAIFSAPIQSRPTISQMPLHKPRHPTRHAMSCALSMSGLVLSMEMGAFRSPQRDAHVESLAQLLRPLLSSPVPYDIFPNATAPLAPNISNSIATPPESTRKTPGHRRSKTVLPRRQNQTVYPPTSPPGYVAQSLSYSPSAQSRSPKSVNALSISSARSRTASSSTWRDSVAFCGTTNPPRPSTTLTASGRG